MTDVQNVPAVSTESSAREAAEWLRDNWITLAGLTVIAVGLWVKGRVLASSFFRQDDFAFLAQALNSRLNWQFLMRVYDGHLMPGSQLYVWVLARIDLYDWTLTSAMTLLMIALASLALLRLLRTLFGNRPGVLIPLAVYSFTPILIPGLSFWSTTFQWVPTQLVLAMALNAHVTYVRTRRFWHAGVAAAWIVAGVLFDDVAILIPLLLFALTSAYLIPGRWANAAVDALRRYWQAWTLYTVLFAGYVVLFFSQLPKSGPELVKPGPFTNVLLFMSTLGRVSLIPAALGGPWHWLPLDGVGFAVEVPVLTQLAWIAAGIVILASVWYRRRAWRCWVILAAWVLLSAVVPLVAGRVGLGYPWIIGADLHYLADSAPVLAVCIGLAFWPVGGEHDAYRGRPPLRLRIVGAGTVLAVFVAGSVWSAHNYESAANGPVFRSYLATARAAVTGAPLDSVIVNTSAAANIENGYFFGRYGYMSQLIGPLAKGLPNHLRWTKAPSGVIPNLLMFDPGGRLTYPAVQGRVVVPPRSAHGCWSVGHKLVRLRIPGTPMYNWPWTVKLAYRGSAPVVLAMTFDGRSHQVALPAGRHQVYIPALGHGDSIGADLVGGGPAVCVSKFSIGVFVPSYHRFPIPLQPLPG